MTQACSQADEAGEVCPRHPKPWKKSLRQNWKSTDKLFRTLKIRYLQIGNDTINRCNKGWINLQHFPGSKHGQYATDQRGNHLVHLKLDTNTTSPWPFQSNSLQLIVSQYTIDKLSPTAAANLFREAHRLLTTGGILRVATPSSRKYLCKQEGGGQMELGSTIKNPLFNDGTKWMYNFNELLRIFQSADIPALNFCRSDRLGAGLPKTLFNAIERAKNPRHKSHACWLDRKDETLYVHFMKGHKLSPNITINELPSCVQPMLNSDVGWRPCI